MSIDELFESEYPVTLVYELLERKPLEKWSEHHRWLDSLLFFYGRIYGGGLSHAIGVASEGVILDSLRLIRKFGSTRLIAWADRLESYFDGKILAEDCEARQEWESDYMKQPHPEFEALDRDTLAIEGELGKAICGYVLEHRDAFS